MKLLMEDYMRASPNLLESHEIYGYVQPGTELAYSALSLVIYVIILFHVSLIQNMHVSKCQPKFPCKWVIFYVHTQGHITTAFYKNTKIKKSEQQGTTTEDDFTSSWNA